ncbi:MAG: hypothetical protein HKO81_09005 [Flavobacteriaceae bacterium]|nr:hypothetical protein [Flavobacteriaceae bacterium]
MIQLPEINSTEITEILDVSSAYLFYDETKPDSIELNRKNLISTTNWLVNVDKRLTLEQAIPSIVFLQNKKRDAQMHKNEAAKNYYTCHYKKINNLGFIDFTDIYYHQEDFQEYLKSKNIKKFNVLFFNSDSLSFKNIKDTLKKLQSLDTLNSKVFFNFDKNLSFQQYIAYKEELLKIDTTQINIDTNEFIY